MIRIWNGTDEGEPVFSLRAQDGRLIDVYKLADVPAALIEAIGPCPSPPSVESGCQMVVSGQIELCPQTDYFAGVYAPLYEYRQLADTAEATACLYSSQVEAYNRRAQVVKDAVVAMWPQLVKAFQERSKA